MSNLKATEQQSQLLDPGCLLQGLGGNFSEFWAFVLVCGEPNWKRGFNLGAKCISLGVKFKKLLYGPIIWLRVQKTKRFSIIRLTCHLGRGRISCGAGHWFFTKCNI